MVDREAFENYITDTFVQQKRNGSKVMARSRGAEITAHLSSVTVNIVFTQHLVLPRRCVN